jgi:2-octaprenylphenol hydroxylase
MNQDFDIAICGAGVTGLLLANLLKDSPYRVALLDAGRPPVVTEDQGTQSQAADSSFDSGFQPRVSALNANSVSLLRQCGVLEKLSRFAAFREMQIKDSEGTGEIHFTTEDLGDVPELGVVVENHLVIGGLYQELLSAENISLLFEHQLEDLDSDQGRTELVFKDQPSVSCELLIAADGGNSKIRELRGRKTFGWNYDQTAIVTTLWCEKPHGNIPRQWFTQAGPLAFLPLAEPNLVSIVWSLSDADSLLALPPEAFCRQLAQASEMDLGSIVATDKRFSFPLRQHHAVRYSEPGIVLIGDAAHTIHPLAGQGANLGLADAAALAQEIRQAVFSETGLSDPELLRRFVQRRQPHNLAMAAAMEAIKQLYGRQNPVLGLLRNRVMSFLDQNSLLKSAMIRVATDSAI